MNNHWYAVWTRSQHEAIAGEELAFKGYEIFLPLQVKLSRRKDRKKILKTPLFPGYLFINTEMNTENYIRIVRSRGVVQVLGYHMGTAKAIQDHEIASIKTILDGNIPLQRHPFIPEGASVLVVNGPMKGVMGILRQYRGKRHIIVQVQLLKQAVSCEMELGDVELLESY